MATFLSKLFKPKWQSKHLPTRLEAIKALDEHQQEEQHILQQLAKEETHPEARSAAINKVTNSQCLISLHGQVDDAIKRTIEARLQQLASAQSLTLFDLILDAELLCEMIVKSEQPDVFINGLGHIEDPQALLTIATHGKTSRIRQAAAELLESEQPLQALANAAKSKDKSVYQIAKNKLNRIRTELKTRAEHRAAVEKILGELEELAHTDNLQMYNAKLESLIQRWDAHVAEASEAERVCFKERVAACKQRSETLEREAREQAEQERLERAGGDEQAATLLMLQETLEHFQGQAASAQDRASLDALIKTQETRWLEATRHTQVEKAQSKKYQNMMHALRHILASVQAFAEHESVIRQEITNIAASREDAGKLASHVRKLKDTLQKVDWPANFAQPHTLQQAHEALGQSADIKQALAENAKALQDTIQQQLKQLDESLEDKQVKASAKLVKAIQGNLAQLDGARAEKLNAKLSLYIKQLHELRDWQSFAASPRQEELCDEMERLCEHTMEPRAKAEKIRAMQKEWKTLGGASDKNLWERFKAAADKAYEPCQRYFDEQQRLKDNNLQRRQTIIEQLGTFIENNDWDNTDWPAADKINQRARQEWKSAFPVDFKANKPLQKEFNRLLGKLDDYLNGERERNHAKKEAIVNEAEALIEQQDLQAAMQQAKALQKSWQEVGITAHKTDRALWKRFRAACDAIFARRDAQREEHHQALADNLDTARQLLATIDNYLNGIDATTPLSELTQTQRDFRTQFKQLPMLAKKEQEPVNHAFQTAMDKLSQQIKERKLAHEKSMWSAAQQGASLCRKAYIAQQDGTLNEALIAEGDTQFSDLSAYPGNLGKMLKELWIGVKANSLPKQAILDNDEARALCIRAEIAAGIDSPDSEKQLRMQLQVGRLSEGISKKVEHQSREAQLAAVLESWYRKVGLSEQETAPYEARIQHCMKSLFGEQ